MSALTITSTCPTKTCAYNHQKHITTTQQNIGGALRLHLTAAAAAAAGVCACAWAWARAQAVLDVAVAALDADAQKVVQVLSGSGVVSPWFMAHVFDVLRGYHPRSASLLSRPLPLFGGDQVEYYRLLFVESLVAQPSLWRLAADVLSWCPTTGAGALAAVLAAVPTSGAAAAGSGGHSPDMRQLLKALHLARAHGLTSTTAAICRSAGMRCWYAGRLDAAVHWLLQCHDRPLLAAVLQPLLQQVEDALLRNLSNYTVAGAAAALPLTDDLAEMVAAVVAAVPLPPVSAAAAATAAAPAGAPSSSSPSSAAAAAAAVHPTLQLLHDFLALHKAAGRVERSQRQQQQQAAAPGSAAVGAVSEHEAAALLAVRDALMSLMDNDTLPRSTCLPLLFFAVPFLEARCLAFSVQDVQRLLTKVSAVTLSPAPRSGGSGNNYSNTPVCHPAPQQPGAAAGGATAAQQQLQKLHTRHVLDVKLALTRALARAHIVESSAAA